VKYALLLVTHGEGRWLRPNLDSFARYVTPRPSSWLAVVDGNDSAHPPIYDTCTGWATTVHAERLGFCATARAAWREAQDTVASDVDYVFWLENDFRFFRPVDLKQVARVLDEQRLAQMSLMRQPVSDLEQRKGGVVASRPGEFISRFGWLQHESYWTTNPSLIPPRTLEWYEWPDEDDGCEGRFGIRLREAGETFGVWGHGDVWVHHLGERDGSGFGY